MSCNDAVHHKNLGTLSISLGFANLGINVEF